MICVDPECTVHYGCRLRAKGVQVSPAATPTRRNKIGPRKADPAWERGRAGEFRADGSFMPYLTETNSTMGVKEFSENRHRIEARVKQLKTDPHVFAAEAASRA